MKDVLCSKYYVVSIKIFIIFILLNICYLLLAAAPAGAQELSLSIDPPIITIRAIPPTTAIGNLLLQNNSENQTRLKIFLKPFKAKSDNGELEYFNLNFEALNEDDLKNLPIHDDIQILDNDIPIEEITLEPWQKKNLSLKITVSSNENITDYYFSILFISKDELSQDSTHSFNQLGIATNILLAIGPKEIPNAVLDKFSSPIFEESGPVAFTVKIKNKGDHFIQPDANIVIKNMFGQTVGNLNLLKTNVLSDSTRFVVNSFYTDQSKPDMLSPKALWTEKFLLGLYTATLNVRFSEEGHGFTKSIHFFAFPYQGIAVIAVMLIITLFINKRIKIYRKKAE